MSLIFYYAPMSTAVSTHWVLEELAVPYEKVRIDIQARDQDRPEFRALNPNGKVPLLVHDGTRIFESAAIAIHLGETFGVERGLFPEPGLSRAVALKWLVWCNVSLASALYHYLQLTSERIPAELRNAAAGALARREVEDLLGILDAELAANGNVLGERFSLVDAHLASFAGYAGICGFPGARWPSIDAWFSRCKARPGYAASHAA